jgi:GNAT superfamily N-acetyltransferase
VSDQDLLAAYDAQLRGPAEMVGADRWEQAGPVVRGVFGDSGFVSVVRPELDDAVDVDALVEEQVRWFRHETAVATFEWKTRGHDRPADLVDRLRAHGFEPEPAETVMIGRADLLAVPVALPDGVVVRRAGAGGDLRDDVRRASATAAAVFGRGSSSDLEERAERLAREPDLVGLWLAEAGGEVVASGRLEVVPGTEFAGLWGGGTLEPWRGRGIYRALVAARARAALDLGVTYLQSDCTDMSRPILERSGLEAVTTTTPWTWTRQA